MRRPHLPVRHPRLVGVGALLAALLAPVPAAVATPGSDPGAAADVRRTATATRLDPADRLALARATAALSDTPADVSSAAPGGRRIDATLALRDLFLARPALDSDSDAAAGRLLARPTDGAGDPYGDGYQVASTQKCAAHVCVHWVRSTQDAPPDDDWAAKTLSVMEQVWRHHVGSLHYRPPAGDGGAGGSEKFDVYLKELGDQGLYGYCAPELRVPQHPKQASGFCVLDNDFARSQFKRPPIQTLRVTAAHEFFHAIQFAYDFREDPWLLESTATWMEERFADSINDNRTYLRYGQVAKPQTSLDLFESSGYAHYGNWAFWEYLSSRFGNGVVRQVIQRTGTGDGLPDDYSVEALSHVLRGKGGLSAVFAAYAAGNTDPRTTYEEGAAFPAADPVAKAMLRAADRRFGFSTRINHLASKTVKLKPDATVAGRRWRLRLTVNAPDSVTSPAAYLIVKRRNGTRLRRAIGLNDKGYGAIDVGFGSRTISAVTLTLANVSTRYRCRRGTSYACAGAPRDQRQPFAVGAHAFRD